MLALKPVTSSNLGGLSPLQSINTMNSINSNLSKLAKKRNIKNLALVSPSIDMLGVDATPSTPVCETSIWMRPQKGVYSNGPIEMLPNLFLGDETNASDPETLRRLNIGFVLNVAREVENPLLETESRVGWQLLSTEAVGETASLYLKKHRFHTPVSRHSHSVFSKKLFWDHNQDNILEFFNSAFRFIDMARSLGMGVLVHCQCGVSRSASLMMGYVMKCQNISFESAYQYVKARSKVVSPNLSLIAQLLEYERSLSHRVPPPKPPKPSKFQSFLAPFSRTITKLSL